MKLRGALRSFELWPSRSRRHRPHAVWANASQELLRSHRRPSLIRGESEALPAFSRQHRDSSDRSEPLPQRLNLAGRKPHDRKHLSNSQARQPSCNCRLIMRERDGHHRLPLHQRLKDSVWSAMRDDYRRELQKFELRGILRHHWVARQIGKFPDRSDHPERSLTAGQDPDKPPRRGETRKPAHFASCPRIRR